MGMYTEIFISADLKSNTPESVIDALRGMCDWEHESETLNKMGSRTKYLFNSGSYYTPNTQCRSLTFDSIANQYSIIGKGDIKNYDSEIEKFFEFIKPYCEDGFIGFYRYEEDREPTLVFAD